MAVSQKGELFRTDWSRVRMSADTQHDLRLGCSSLSARSEKRGPSGLACSRRLVKANESSPRVV
jgi:hypothetical protein